jgi:Tfp pilus assembly protein PilN
MKRIHLNLATTQGYDRKTVYPLMAASVLLVFLLSFYNFHRYSRYTSEVREIEKRIAQMEKTDAVRNQAAQPSSPSPSKKEIDSLKEQAGFVNRLIAADIFPWDRFLDELESCTPPDVLILRFASGKEKDRFRIEGRAGSMREITEFLKGLDRSTLYRDSVLLNVTTLKEAGQAATLTPPAAIRFEIESTAALEPTAAGFKETPPRSPFTRGGI